MISLSPALRILFKKKSFSILNIIGLAVGIAASLLIFLVIKNELTFDHFHKKADRIYRVVSTQANKSNGEIGDYSGGVPIPLPDVIQAELPQIESVGRYWSIGQAQIYIPGKDMSADEKRFKENDGLFWVDAGLFDVFDYKWLAGNGTGLKAPNTVVLASSFARKFYGSDQAAIGNTLQLWSFRIPFQVVGVFKDQPANTDMNLFFGASVETVRSQLRPDAFTNPEAWDWHQGNHQCFVSLKQEVSNTGVIAPLASFSRKYPRTDPAFNRQFHLQPLKSIHLDEKYENFNQGRLSSNRLFTLGLIGAFLLFVACINFINLATAQSVNRAKEIGVRKVLGGNKTQLIFQFMKETALITALALIAGFLLALAGLPFLNKLINKGLTLSLLQEPSILFYLLITGFIVTVLAGLYPAFVLSGFQPATVFKYKVRTKAGGLYLRRGLVVFQFVIAQLLIIGTVVAIKQMQYFKEKPLGFDKDGIVLINLPSDSSLKVKYAMLKSRMEEIPGVQSTSLCMEAPTSFWFYTEDVYYNNDAQKRDFSATHQFADTGYFKTFGLSLIAGRKPFASDTTRELVVNETMVRKLGLKSYDDILGQMISFNGANKYPVVGVVKDFNNKNLKEELSAVAISTQFPTYEWIAVRMHRDQMQSTLPQVQKLFTGIYPSYIYDQVFFDERIEQFYTAEAVTSQLFKVFSFLAILISCLGLYGLVSFMAVQKTKEVGIRKVLGASARSIVYLFSKEFTILIGIAFLLAAPLGYYLMKTWLDGFYYHTELGAGIFILAIVGSVSIAWITVGYKAVRAALANPVKSLKTE